MKRFDLINRGVYPETTPPCFVSKDAKRAFHGLVAKLDKAKFHNHKSEFTRYNGTKHDGNRRYFGTPNIVSYFHVSTFITQHWDEFEAKFAKSKYSIGAPTLLDDSHERAVQVPSLSELSAVASRNLSYAPFVLKADIAQFFPSIYTHSISWAAHGIENSKKDTDEKSKTNYFNALDFFVRNCQRANTRGVLVGPDAFRIVAEFISATLDEQIKAAVGELIVGAVRHVDDYYFGLTSEADALVVLSKVREVLAGFELQLNDLKTRIYPSVEPINDLWAQSVRKTVGEVSSGFMGIRLADLEYAIDETLSVAREVGSDSPVKILLRRLDEIEIYSSAHWGFAEQYLQRVLHRHPHAIDYVCLLVVKRFALGLEMDKEGWGKVATILLKQHIAYNNHHEVLWLAWLIVVCQLEVSDELFVELARNPNSHIKAFLIQAYVDGLITKKPKISLGGKLSTENSDWLSNLVGRSQGYSKAKFSGNFSTYFEHLADRHIKLIDFGDHIDAIKEVGKSAISRSRYGYDADGDEDDDDDFNLDF